MKVGISNIAYDIPKIYLNIDEYAKNRNLNTDKLKKGLGIHKMAILDYHQDTATLAGNALHKLISQKGVNAEHINRIYLGTESALDGSKPTCTYALDMIEKQFGRRIFKNTDVVDMTFACIGGVDVLQNALDYIYANPEQNAIVIASDFAKYKLNSPGEYTQGAGAVAMYLESNPKLLEIDSKFGVGFKSEHDFFKPRRYHKTNDYTSKYTSDSTLQVYSEEPVFDGQFSNQCYQDRIREAYFHFKTINKYSSSLYNTWAGLIFHLPYAFHGKRIFTEIYQLEKDNINEPSSAHYNLDELKAIGKSEDYTDFVSQKILPAQKASSQIGNMYSASIFMSLISELWYKKQELKPLDKLGFIAYGSGSKAKVFEATLVDGFKSQCKAINLDQTLDNRIAIDFDTYKDLHTKNIDKSIVKPKNEFALTKIEDEKENLQGCREYSFIH